MERQTLASSQISVQPIVLRHASNVQSCLMRENQSETVAAIHRLKQDIDSLSEQQAEALKTATFVGMTPDELVEYDKRGEKITELIRQLTLLQKPQ
jgi:hypothetical protein